MERRLVGTNELVADFLKNLTEVEIFEEEWSTKYVDKISGKEWLKYCFEDRRFRFDLIQIKPPLTTEDLIKIAVSSTYEDEAVAATNRLHYEEISFKRDYRKALIESIEQKVMGNLDNAENAKLENVITAGKLTDPTNRTDFIRKSYAAVNLDAAYYKNIADRANNILSNIRARNYLLP
jgi:hypothetical protein